MRLCGALAFLVAAALALLLGAAVGGARGRRGGPRTHLRLARHLRRGGGLGGRRHALCVTRAFRALLFLDRAQARGGALPALRLVEHGLLAPQAHHGLAVLGTGRVDTGGDDEALLAPTLRLFEAQARLGALSRDALALGSLFRTRRRGQRRPAEQQPDQAMQPHVSEVSTARRSSARNSADCISARRDTVRGNSWASGPSV